MDTTKFRTASFDMDRNPRYRSLDPVTLPYPAFVGYVCSGLGAATNAVAAKQRGELRDAPFDLHADDLEVEGARLCAVRFSQTP